jgi:hypothetical protein
MSQVSIMISVQPRSAFQMQYAPNWITIPARLLTTHSIDVRSGFWPNANLGSSQILRFGGANLGWLSLHESSMSCPVQAKMMDPQAGLIDFLRDFLGSMIDRSQSRLGKPLA